MGVWGQEADTVGDYFLLTEAGTSARMIRLGNIEGYSSLANTIFENPAGMFRINRLSVSAFTTTLMEEVTYRNLALSVRLPVGIIGFGYMSVGVDDIPKTIEETNRFFRVGSFGYKNSLGKVAYQVSQSRNLHFGAALGLYSTQADTFKGDGVNMDFGMLLTTDVLEFSFLLRNVFTGSDVRYTDTEEGENSSDGRIENLPFQSLYSLKWSLRHIQFYGQLKTVGTERSLLKSLSANLNPSFLRFLHVSAGVKEYPIVRSIEGVYEEAIDRA